MFEESTEKSLKKSQNQNVNLTSLEKLGEWKNLFLGLFDVARDLHFILDEDGRFILINELGAASLDYSVE